MKKVVIVLLLLGGLAVISWSRSTKKENPAKYTAGVRYGKPCKVEVTQTVEPGGKHPYPLREATLWLDRNGYQTLQQAMQLHDPEKYNDSRNYVRFYYSEGLRIAREDTRIDTDRDGEKSTGHSSSSNYWAESGGMTGAWLPIVNKVTYKKEAVDTQGNWTEATYREDKVMWNVTRKIYYFDSDPIAAAEADRVASETQAITGLTCWLWIIPHIYRPGYFGVWAVAFWLIFLCGFARFIYILNGRCPRCASWSSKITGSELKRKLSEEWAHHEDGRKELQKRRISYDGTVYRVCRNCGYMWDEMITEGEAEGRYKGTISGD